MQPSPAWSWDVGYQYIDGLDKSNTGKYDSYVALIGLAYTFGQANQPARVDFSNVQFQD